MATDGTKEFSIIRTENKQNMPKSALGNLIVVAVKAYFNKLISRNNYVERNNQMNNLAKIQKTEISGCSIEN